MYLTNSLISLLILIVLSFSRLLTFSLTFSIFLTLFLPKYQQFACLKNSQKFLSKRKSNQNVKAKRGVVSEVYVEVNWEWFGGVFRAATSKFEHRLRYGFSSLLAPFPRGSLRFKLFISKLRLFPRCMSLSLAPYDLRLGILVDRIQGYLFVVMISFRVHVYGYVFIFCVFWEYVCICARL